MYQWNDHQTIASCDLRAQPQRVLVPKKESYCSAWLHCFLGNNKRDAVGQRRRRSSALFFLFSPSTLLYTMLASVLAAFLLSGASVGE